MSFACQYLNLPSEVYGILRDTGYYHHYLIWKLENHSTLPPVEDHRSIIWICSGDMPSKCQLLSHWLVLVTSLSCLLLPVYHTAFCFPLQSSACCPQPMEGSLCTLLFFWGLAATFFFPSCYFLLPITSLTRCDFSPHHVPGQQACSSTPFQPHWSVLLFILIVGNFHSSHSFIFIHSSLLI